MSKKSASPTVSQDLAYILARTESDPLLFVQAAFPWGKDELKNHSILAERYADKFKRRHNKFV